jgi:sugar/nucleoside kinase (ribokinase family)
VSVEAQAPRTVLCLGEALVDLICERPVAGLGEVDALVPHFGGAVANVALLAARAGAAVSLAGGAGDDPWGAWLLARLQDEGVDVERFRLIDGLRTPLALVTVDQHGEAVYTIYGDAIATVTHSLGLAVGEAVAASTALFISSNTLVGPAEREVTMAAREAALELERPIMFDPNLRLHRWSTRADATATANACVPGAMLVRCNAAEAELLTGERDVERAAMALRKAGAGNVVISLGQEGAILRGKIRLDVPGVAAEVRSTIGAGDALTATLLARLSGSGFYEPAIAAGLRDAVAAGAQACERWGAVD